jgi:acyl dehydratase
MFDHSLIDTVTETTKFEYGWQSAVTYALGIGAKADELDYLYEGRGPAVYPTFALAPALDTVIGLIDRCGGTGARRVHSAQTLPVHAPIPPSGKLEISATIRGIYDHKKFATVAVETVSKDAASGQALIGGLWTFLFPGAGDFGGSPPPGDKAPAPTGKPDFVATEASAPEQALVYRLSGDLNPLHVDPEIAKSKGFDAPILQGLCTFGFMMRAARAAGDLKTLRKFGGQFRRPALPGDTFVTEGWRVDGNAWALGLRAEGRPDPLIAAGFAHFG